MAARFCSCSRPRRAVHCPCRDCAERPYPQAFGTFSLGDSSRADDALARRCHPKHCEVAGHFPRKQREHRRCAWRKGGPASRAPPAWNASDADSISHSADSFRFLRHTPVGTTGQLAERETRNALSPDLLRAETKIAQFARLTGAGLQSDEFTEPASRANVLRARGKSPMLTQLSKAHCSFSFVLRMRLEDDSLDLVYQSI
jgi:hypothetical protein